MSEAELKSHFLTGLNFPPSQFQLHIQVGMHAQARAHARADARACSCTHTPTHPRTQCILMPLTPFHYHMYREGQHFTAGRFFPLEYIRAILGAKHTRTWVHTREAPRAASRIPHAHPACASRMHIPHAYLAHARTVHVCVSSMHHT